MFLKHVWPQLGRDTRPVLVDVDKSLEVELVICLVVERDVTVVDTAGSFEVVVGVMDPDD